MHSFPLHLASRLFNAGIALNESDAPLALQLLGQSFPLRADGGAASEIGAGEEWGSPRRGSGSERPYDVIAGVAVIPVKGVLIQRLGWLWHYGEYFGISGYDRIRFQFVAALADPDVDAIALDVDSPGGEVAGCFDLVDTIYRARGVKPIAGILGENAYSAAYALVSAVDPGRLWVPRTGGTGSVGVIYLHLSIAKWLANNGITPTLITKGALKGEGSEMIDLSDDALARIQADVDAVGEIFDATVARNRGMAKKDVTATQAGTFPGSKGVDIGFADAVAAPDEAFRALLKQLD
ncbi:S49 family peptidase [Flavisphingomonas formosensis]|uniref:S49 family peptidase n=1 Tax=Flavisphingomonas formosensis TaxID=861534 RepID=UPI0012F8B6C9|nr:S49 family peptidase [Sphingomonas formosensis]